MTMERGTTWKADRQPIKHVDFTNSWSSDDYFLRDDKVDQEGIFITMLMGRRADVTIRQRNSEQNSPVSTLNSPLCPYDLIESISKC